MSKLFEEAIADAKKLKEVAEENAKKAILESVTPQIREFIEEQLLEEKEEESADEAEDNSGPDDLDEEVYLDEGALASLVNLIGEDALDSLNESKSQDALFGAVKGAVSGMDQRQRSKLLNISRKVNKSANHLSETIKGENMSKKYYEVDLRALREAVEMEEEGVDLDEEETEELDELYEQFAALLEQDEEEAEGEELPPEEDVEMEDLPEGGDDMLSRDDVEEAIRGLIDELELDLGEGGEAPLPGGEEEFDLDAMMAGEGDEGGEPEEMNEVFEVDPRVLRQEINRVKRLVREGKMDHHFGGKGGGKVGVDGAFGGKGNKKAGVNGAFGGGSYGKDPFVNPPQINKLNEAVRQLRRQNRSQQEKLNKYRGAVNSLREQLEDLNLFNAKLLYVNKLLQNKGLNESQKKSVIKALDEAQSLQEAKSLYNSLTETFKRGGKKTLSESRVLGSSSRPTTSAQSNATSNNAELGRWQRLAGL
jgi:hypothetical protein